MSSRHRILSVLMVSSLGVLVGGGLAGCGSTDTGVPVDENDTGTDETSSETSDDTATTDDTGSDDTGTTDDTGTAAETTSEAGDTGTIAETSDTSVTEVAADTAVADAADTAVLDTGSDTGTVADTAAAPTCASTTLASTAAGMAYPDRFVRQGFGNLFVAVTGTNLATATTATLGAISCVITTKTATSLLALCVVPHGAALGAKDLVITSSDGSGTCAATATIDKITSSAATGNDTTGRGTSTAPFRSVARALSVADAGDTVYLMSGVYGATTGDAWTTAGATDPIPSALTVKSGVAIEGDPAGGTVLSGIDNRVAFRVAATTTLRDLTLTGFRFGVATDKAGVTLTNVAIKNSIREAVYVATNAGALTMSATAAGSGATSALCLLDSNYIGVHVTTGGKATLTNCDVIKSTAAGAEIEGPGTSSLTTTSTRFLDNGTVTGTGLFLGKVGIAISDGSALSMTGGEVTRSYDYGIVATNTAQVTLSGTSIKDNGLAIGGASTANSGVSYQGFGGAGSLKVTGGTVSGNANFGIGVSGNVNTELTGVTITGNANSGLNFGSSGTLTAKGVNFAANTTAPANANNAQISITDGANASTKIEFLAEGATQTSIARATASTTVALVRDGRPAPSATGTNTTIQFATGTLFQGATMPSGTRTAPVTTTGATPYDVLNASMTQLVFRLVGATRKVQVL